MREDLMRAAAAIGELYAAALNDHADASPEDVGLHGVHIKTWREAYAEGCKDMGEKITSCIEDGQQEFRAAVLDSFHKHRAQTAR